MQGHSTPYLYIILYTYRISYCKCWWCWVGSGSKITIVLKHNRILLLVSSIPARANRKNFFASEATGGRSGARSSVLTSGSSFATLQGWSLFRPESPNPEMRSRCVKAAGCKTLRIERRRIYTWLRRGAGRWRWQSCIPVHTSILLFFLRVKDGRSTRVILQATFGLSQCRSPWGWRCQNRGWSYWTGNPLVQHALSHGSAKAKNGHAIAAEAVKLLLVIVK